MCDAVSTAYVGHHERTLHGPSIFPFYEASNTLYAVFRSQRMCRIHRLTLYEHPILIGDHPRTLGPMHAEQDVRLLVGVRSVVAGQFSVPDDVRKVSFIEPRDRAEWQEVIGEDIFQLS